VQEVALILKRKLLLVRLSVQIYFHSHWHYTVLLQY